MASVTVTQPTSTSNWQAGTTQTIQWSASIDDTSEFIVGFLIQLFDGNTLDSQILNTSNGNLRAYNWTIPSNQSPDTDYKIKITMTVEEFE